VATDLVRALVRGRPVRDISSATGLRRHLSSVESVEDTVERAALAGRAADGPAWAFAAGYEGALAKLDPAATRGGSLVAFCATEEGGGHPRSIRSSLSERPGGGFALTGSKTFVTLGADADMLLVVASTGEREGRNVLRVARVPSRREGVTLRPAPPMPFASEVGHARATFEAVPVEEADLLAGDGYDDALKPFRTIEDVHVLAALLGWAIGVALESVWARAWIEEAVALTLLLRTLGRAPPLSAETHVALGGALTAAHRLLHAGAWSTAPGRVHDAWERDRALLTVASTVRAARLASAWGALVGAQ